MSTLASWPVWHPCLPATRHFTGSLTPLQVFQMVYQVVAAMLPLHAPAAPAGAPPTLTLRAAERAFDLCFPERARGYTWEYRDPLQ